MLVTAKAKYEAGGYPLPTYSGETDVSLNASRDQDDDEIRESLATRARTKIAHDLCFTTANVRITEINSIHKHPDPDYCKECNHPSSHVSAEGLCPQCEQEYYE